MVLAYCIKNKIKLNKNTFIKKKISKMSKLFLIRVNSENIDLYQNHKTYNKGDSGLDLFVIKDQLINPGETILVDFGIQCQNISKRFFLDWFKLYKYNSYLLIPRSSISKTPLMMKNSIGLIDAGYTGNIKAPLYNTSSEPFYIKRGERYVQLVNSDLSSIHFKLVNSHRNTTRNTGGFGSTN
jgi:dUTP pyrophosphatase